MRAPLLAIALLLLTATPAAAAAASAPPVLVLGPADGVQATRAGKALTVTFGGDSARRAGVAGKTVSALCRPHPGPSELAFAEDGPNASSGDGKVGADGVAHLKLSSDVPVDVCELLSFDADRADPTVARAALTPAGETWIDEAVRASALHVLLARARTAAGAYRPATALGAGLVALDGPDAAPPAAGQTGYWTDGTRAAATTLSAAGRPLVIQDLGRGVLRTNVLEQSDPLSELLPDLNTFSTKPPTSPARDPEDDPGASPYRGEHALTPSDGVHARADGRRLAVRFTGRAAKTLRALAGRKVMVLCRVRPPASPFPLGLRAADFHRAWTRVPRRGGIVRFTLAVAPAGVCTLADDGTTIAEVPADATGRGWQQDLHALGLLVTDDADEDRFAPAGATAYWPTATVVAHGRKVLVAMAGPGAPVPVGRVGVWTDGAHRAAEATVSASGHRAYLVDEGDGMVRTNVFGQLDLLTLLGSDSGE